MPIPEYKRLVRIAYTASDNNVRVSIPDSLKFPSTQAHVHLKDQSTIVISPNKTKMTTWSLNWYRQKVTPGCRHITFLVTHLGKHFRMASTLYQVHGEDLHVVIPSEEERITPKQRIVKKPAIKQCSVRGCMAEAEVEWQGHPVCPPCFGASTVRGYLNNPPMSPVQQVAKVIAEGEARARDRGTVLVELDFFDDTLEFSIPTHELMPMVLEWTAKRWRR